MDSYGICQSMLADPTDITAGAQARRDRVRARIQAYNAAMTAACARHSPHCRGDGNAVFNYRFDLKDVSPSDYWHPSERGQEHWHKPVYSSTEVIAASVGVHASLAPMRTVT